MDEIEGRREDVPPVSRRMAQAWVADTETLVRLNARAVERGGPSMSDQAEADLLPDGQHAAIITYGPPGELVSSDTEYLSTWAIQVPRGLAIVHIQLPIGDVVSLPQAELPDEMAEQMRADARDYFRELGEQAEEGRFIEQAEDEIDRLTGGDF